MIGWVGPGTCGCNNSKEDQQWFHFVATILNWGIYSLKSCRRVENGRLVQLQLLYEQLYRCIDMLHLDQFAHIPFHRCRSGVLTSRFGENFFLSVDLMQKLQLLPSYTWPFTCTRAMSWNPYSPCPGTIQMNEQLWTLDFGCPPYWSAILLFMKLKLEWSTYVYYIIENALYSAVGCFMIYSRLIRGSEAVHIHVNGMWKKGTRTWEWSWD